MLVVGSWYFSVVFASYMSSSLKSISLVVFKSKSLKKIKITKMNFTIPENQ